jgi:hypothetical protein
MEVDHDLGNGDSLPTSPPSHPPAQRTIGPGASFDLATTARIEDLCDKISCLSNDRINRWHPAEEELLRILRAHKVPYQDITVSASLITHGHPSSPLPPNQILIALVVSAALLATTLAERMRVPARQAEEASVSQRRSAEKTRNPDSSGGGGTIEGSGRPVVG